MELNLKHPSKIKSLTELLITVLFQTLASPDTYRFAWGNSITIVFCVIAVEVINIQMQNLCQIFLLL